MRTIIIQALIALFFTVTSFSQSDPTILAKIGNDFITKDEFQQRYELTPQLFRENKKIKEELKVEFLYSLAAEKLLSLYGDEIRLDTITVVKNYLKILEEMFVRDALYKREIQDKAAAKADSLLSYYLANANNVKLIYINSDSENEIKNIYDLLKIGVAFDSLYTELASDNTDTITVSIGQLSEEIESKIFPLPDEAFTQPIQLDGKYYIFKILKRYNPIIAKSFGWESDFKKSQKIAKERAENEFYQVYMQKFFKNKQVKINGKLLKNISTQFYNTIKNRIISNQTKGKIDITSEDIWHIENHFGYDSLQLPFIELSDNFLIAKDFLNYLRFENLNLDSLDFQIALKTLSAKTKSFVEYKMLAAEGYKQNLQLSIDVKKKLKIWKDNYFMQLVASQFIDSVTVSDEEIAAFYNEQKNGKLKDKQVNVLQLFSDSLETVETILNEITKGEDFEYLINKYYIKSSNNNYNRESGFFSVSPNNEVGRIAASLKIGDVYGPIPVKNGYLIFKLIGIREDSTFITEDFEEIKKDLRNNLTDLKKQNSLNRFIGDLANKYGLKLNLETLQNISVTSLQSVVYSHLGFGGRILAVPILNVNMEWVLFWKNNIIKIQ